MPISDHKGSDNYLNANKKYSKLFLDLFFRMIFEHFCIRFIECTTAFLCCRMVPSLPLPSEFPQLAVRIAVRCSG